MVLRHAASHRPIHQEKNLHIGTNVLQDAFRDIHIERYGIHTVFLFLHSLSYPAAGTKTDLLCCTGPDVLLL